MVTAQEINLQIQTEQKNLGELDTQRLAEIEKQRSPRTGDIDIGLRKSINDNFQRQSERIKARIRALRQVKSQIGEREIEEEQLKGIVQTAQQREEVAFRRGAKREEALRKFKEQTGFVFGSPEAKRFLREQEQKLPVKKEVRQDVFFGGFPSQRILEERESGIEIRREFFEKVLPPGEFEKIEEQRELFKLPTEPFLEQKPTGEFLRREGREIPITEIAFVDPLTGFRGIVTKEERELFLAQQKVVREVKGRITPTIKERIEETFELPIKERIQEIQTFQETELQRRRVGEEVRIGQRVAGFAGGLGESIFGGLIFAERAITRPVATGREVITSIPEIPTRLKEFGIRARVQPERAIGIVTAELIQARLLGEAIRGTGRLGERVVTRISPKFKPVTEIAGVKAIREIPTKRGVPIDIEISAPVKRILEPLSKQVRQAGKVEDIVTAQRGLFGRILKREVVVRKPLPTPKAPPLEQALFAAPGRQLRISRLGVFPLEEVRLRDILRKGVTFKRPRPQAILFEQVRIAKFPARLKDVERALRAGKQLTPSQATRLQRFQLAPTGEFKPIGFLTREPEVVLAPGEIIRKRGVPALTIIEKRRVPIIRAEIVKATPETRKLLARPSLTIKESKQLLKNLAKETGIDVSRALETRPFISPIRLGISGVAGLARVSGAVSPEVVSRIAPRIVPRVAPRIAPREVLRVAPRIVPRMVSRLIPRITPRIVPRITPRPAPRLAPLLAPILIKEPPIPKPFIPIETKLKKRREKLLGREDVAIVESLAARVAGLEPQRLTEAQVRKLALAPTAGLFVQRAPILIK